MRAETSRRIFLCVTILIVYVAAVASLVNQGPYRWMKRDNFDDLMERMDQVNIDNCASMPASSLRLPAGSVGQIPAYNTIPLHAWYKNRTSLLYMHTLAYNRAHFFSYILQKLNTSKVDFPLLPGFLYYYFSTSADVSSGYGVINGSAVLMDTNCTYANWLTDLDFNKTLPLFGPKAMRLDDWMDENNWLREPTNHTIQVEDIGAGPNSNYTADWYRTNPYVTETNFLPDQIGDITTKYQYDTEIQYVNPDGTAKGMPISRGYFGPTAPGEKENNLPVRFTSPYFDCGKTNKWIVTAVAPVVDYMYRYSNQTRLRNGKIVGLITMDIDFLRIDFNPCPQSQGNDPHYLAGTDRCKKDTTQCEPLNGFQYRRGGYQCHCKPGYRLPYTQNGPFQGVDIERATEEEYKSGFDCLRIGWMQTLPVDGDISKNLERKKRSADELNPDTQTFYYHLSNPLKFAAGVFASASGLFSGRNTEQHLVSSNIHPHDIHIEEELPIENEIEKKNPNSVSPRHPWDDTNLQTSKNLSPSKKLVSRKRRDLTYLGKNSAFDADQYSRVKEVLAKFSSINSENCHSKSDDELSFPGEVGYGADVRFEMQARTALRLAHFLSAFYQNNIAGEIYGNLRVDQPLNKHHLFGEVIANVIGDSVISTSGIFYDTQQFYDAESAQRLERFAPYAYRPPETTQTFKAIDMSLKKYRNYVSNPWFQFLKERWASNTYGLERIVNKPWKRQDINGSMVERFDNYPLYYRAPKLEDGYWTQPYFDCDGMLKEWFITYAVPFFGLPRQDSPLQFMGVVTVSMKLSHLDINQCPSSFYTANFFKNTARCDYRTTYCVPWDRRGFNWGAYRCECRQGFEHPIYDFNWYYEGQTMESEYDKKLRGEKNRFDTLRCRQALGVVHKSSLFLSILAVSLSVFYYYK